MYNECLCLGCKDRINDNVNLNDLRISFANNVIGNDNIDQGPALHRLKIIPVTILMSMIMIISIRDLLCID